MLCRRLARASHDGADPQSASGPRHLGMALADLQCCDALADGCLLLFPFIAWNNSTG